MVDFYRSDLNFYDYKKARTKINNIYCFGYIYKLCKKLTVKQKETLSNYNNVIILNGCSEFSPELKFDAVFIATCKSKKNIIK